jgi:GntR family transcriptional regulator, transcriptional repressor for pyruvate dehydrogenase complex
MARKNRIASLAKPVSSMRLSEQIANQIIDIIAANRLKPGERLPSEADLCEAFHVGRSTAREAIRSLAFAGIVKVRAGGGTYLADAPLSALATMRRKGLANERDLGYVIETRFTLETRTATLCAERATDKELQEIERIVAKMQSCIEAGGAGFLEADIEFHLAIATASKNPILREFMLSILDPVLHIMYATKGAGLGGCEWAQKQHVRILAALKKRDPKQAGGAMQAHLKTYWRRGAVFFNGKQK